MRIELPTVARVLTIGLAALALTLFFVAVGHTEPAPPPVSLTDRIEKVIPSLASKKEPSVDARELAEAIATASKGDVGWAALLLTIAANESALSARIARGECSKHECDSFRSKSGELLHRAAGLYQIHANTQNAAVWDSPDLLVQTTEALRMLKQAAGRCSKFREVPRSLCIVRAYAGRVPSMPIPGEARRVAMVARLIARLQ